MPVVAKQLFVYVVIHIESNMIYNSKNSNCQFCQVTQVTFLSAFEQTLSCVENLAKQEKSYSYLHLFKTPKIRQMTLLSGIVW